MMSGEIGIFVTKAYVSKFKTETISGHVQIALITANILHDLGKSVVIITNQFPPNTIKPPILKTEVKVLDILPKIQKSWPKTGIFFENIPLFLILLRQIIKKFDVLQVFGDNRILLLFGSLSKMTKSNCVLLNTYHNFNNYKNNVIKYLHDFVKEEIDLHIGLTEFSKNQLIKANLNRVQLCRFGVFDAKRNIKLDYKNEKLNGLKPYILFWRNADYYNGADLCIEIFIKLSNEYPSLNFLFAVRPGCEYDNEIINVSKSIPNIHAMFYPYKDQLDIKLIIKNSLCVVLPFRKLSINPQLAILETMNLGKVLLTTKIESNNELIKDGFNGFITKIDKNKLIIRLREIINLRSEMRNKIGKNAHATISEKWSIKSYSNQIKNLYDSL